MASRRLTVAGPFELRQGGTGLIGRLAVFLPAPGEPRGERFWGFVTAVIRVDRLVAAAHLDRLEARGYRHTLSRYDPERRVERCFAGCTGPLDRPVTFQVAVPNGSWTLSLAPRAGWPAPPWRPHAWVALLLVATAVSVLAWSVLRAPALLQRQVAQRTEELARANAALADEMRRLRESEDARRSAEEQLRQAQKLEAVGRLAGGIAHDFNNLLTGILGEASVLAERTPPGSEEREAAETIGGAARRAAELTRRLLGFARREPLRSEVFDAHGVAREVARLLERTLDARIRVVTRLDAPRAAIVGDPGQLQQALLNLALNARDAMPEGGELRLESSVVERDAAWAARTGARPGPHLALAVGDDGHGIAPELQSRLFEPFFTTKAPGRGTGLGLSVVYGVATAHGGAVEVESAPGQGARFVVSLPLAPEDARPEGAPEPAPRPRGAGRVLVVDDDDLARAGAVALLRAAGYQPEVARSGEEALRHVRERGDDLRSVLLDVAMPGLDGPATLAALRALAPGLPVVFTSGYAPDGRAQDAALRGEAGFLPKPFDARALVDAIEARRRAS